MDNTVSRLLDALIAGIIAGLIAAVVVWLLSALLPGVSLSPSFWGTVIGLIVALYRFVKGNGTRAI